MIGRLWQSILARERLVAAFVHVRTVRIAFGLVVLVSVMVLAALAWAIHGNRANARQGKQAHDALCVFREDLARRIVDGRVFLEQHPEGFAGISAATIRTSIETEEGMLITLVRLSCPDPAR